MSEDKTIVRWLVRSIFGDVYWVELPTGFELGNVLAYGWSDGSVTWKP